VVLPSVIELGGGRIKREGLEDFTNGITNMIVTKNSGNIHREENKLRAPEKNQGNIRAPQKRGKSLLSTSWDERKKTIR